jgi:periplasmic divalent cation tolerance protein
MAKTDFVLIYTTCSNKEDARKIAKHLMGKKLVACANIYENMNGLYWWKGEIADETQTTLIVKTTEANYKKAEAEIEKIHSDTIHCIIKIPVSSNKKYFDWLCSEVQ